MILRLLLLGFSLFVKPGLLVYNTTTITIRFLFYFARVFKDSRIWGCGALEIWRLGNLEKRASGNFGTPKFRDPWDLGI